MTPKKKFAIYNTGMKDLNRIFDDFQNDYAATFRHYARHQSCSEEMLLFKDFKETYRESLDQDEAVFAHPKFMREFLGAGVLPSFKTTGELRDDSKKAVNPPSRIGLALSTFHHVMRNTGKIWGLYFDPSGLDAELKPILEWMEEPEKHPRPEIYKGKSDEFIVEDITQRFAAMPSVPIRIPARYSDKEPPEDIVARVPNTQIHFRRVVYGEADSYTEEYDIPAAALAWSIRAAGMSIQGRSNASPMRPLLQKIVGIGRDAGQKMLELNQLAPDIYKDYDPEQIAGTLYDQKAWIKTARAVERIRGNSGGGYEEALHLIDADKERLNVLSAYKVGVILYAIVERMEQMEAGTSKRASEVKSIVRGHYNGMSFNELTQRLKDLTSCLHEEGITTEDQLRIIKRDDIFEPDPKHYYREHLEAISGNQKEHLREFFGKDPKYAEVVQAFFEVIPEFKKTLGPNDALPEYAEFVAEFCNHHMTSRFGHKGRHQRTHQTLGLE